MQVQSPRARVCLNGLRSSEEARVVKQRERVSEERIVGNEAIEPQQP